MARSKSDPPTELGENLRLVRRATGATLREIEKRSGLSNGYLSQLERGEVGQPSPTVLRKLAEGYGIDFRILLGWIGYIEEELPALTPNQVAALSTIGDPSTEELRALQGIWDLLRSKGTATASESPVRGIELSPIERLEVAKYARALLKEAGAFGVRPTPLGDLQEAARLARSEQLDLSSADKKALARKLGHWVDVGWRRLRGALDFRTRSIWIKPDLHRKQERFTIAHEIGHAILPAHQDFFGYVDTLTQLQPDVRSLLEREANFAGAQLLFQCGEATEEADSSFLSLGLICEIADRFGASIVATARELAETSRRDVAVAIGYQPNDYMGPTNLFVSQSFTERFRWREGLAPHPVLRDALLGARTPGGEDEWVVSDVRDSPNRLRVETMHTGYAALALIVRDSSVKRTVRKIVVPTMS